MLITPIKAGIFPLVSIDSQMRYNRLYLFQSDISFIITHNGVDAGVVVYYRPICLSLPGSEETTACPGISRKSGIVLWGG